MGLPQVFAEIDKKLAECTDEVALACKYLYAFMPYSDIGNYAFEVFLDYAENGVYLWKENSGVAELPEEIKNQISHRAVALHRFAAQLAAQMTAQPAAL